MCGDAAELFGPKLMYNGLKDSEDVFCNFLKLEASDFCQIQVQPNQSPNFTPKGLYKFWT